MGFDPARVVELYTAGLGVGSGYAVSGRLVLSAAHAVPPVGGGCELRPVGTDGWGAGRVVWVDGPADVALVEAAAGPWAALTTAVRWGRVEGAEPLWAVAVGFPWAGERGDGGRGSESAAGYVSREYKSGRLDLSVQSSAPRLREPAPDGSPRSAWAGMSGAGVFAGPVLVGVVTDERTRFTSRLAVTPLAPLLEEGRGLAAALAGHGAAVPVAGSLSGPVRLAVGAGRGVALRAPYLPLPDWDPQAAPSQLLLPEHGLVPFVGRGQTVRRLVDWCVTGDADQTAARARLRLRLVTGPAGSGKSRLAAEVCARLAGAGSWDVGFVRETAGPAPAGLERASLLVVDDADLAGPMLPELIESLASDRAGPRVRLLLLARHAQPTTGWWARLVRDTGNTAAGLADDPVPLARHPLDQATRRAHAAAATDAFAPYGPAGQPPATAPDLSGAAFGNLLLVHMTMLLATLDRSALPDTTATDVRDQVLHGVLNLERNRWAASLRRSGDTDLANLAADAEDNPTDADLVRAITATTLAAPTSERHTLAVLRAAVPGLSDAPTSLLGRLYRWLRGLYPADHDGGIAPLRPDLLAEQLLAETADLTGLTLAVLTALLPTPPAGAESGNPAPAGTRLPAAGQTCLAGLLDELTRASGRPPVHTATEAILDQALAALTRLAITHRHDDPASPLPPALTRTVTAVPRPDLAGPTLALLPWPSRTLADLAAALASQVADLCRRLAEAAPDAYLPNLAASLNNLATFLSEVGRRADALAPATEAVTIRRQLAETAPDAYLPNLAASLNNLANRLSEVGRRADALAPATEATDLYRRLAEAAPDAYLPDLAMSLNNLAIRLSEVGRRADALAPATEAVRIFTEFAERFPARFAENRDTVLATLRALTMNSDDL